MSQHMDALARANEIRLARADLKRQVHDGEVTVGQILQDPPLEVQTMAISDLLQAQFRWGEYRARKLCTALVISERRPIGRLTARERDRICGMLRYSAQDVEWAA
jgi:hypothetical protein